MNSENKTLVTNFIKEIWNNIQFEKLHNYISPHFIDHSLPPDLTPDIDGLKQWIMLTGKSFEHNTIIEEIVCEENKVMIKIRMYLKHIGAWRSIEATHMIISTIGYRYFKIADGKITEHWALIDGNSIENQLKDAAKGCKIQT